MNFFQKGLTTPTGFANVEF